MGEPPFDLDAAKRSLGEGIRARRNALGISQEGLADRSGVHWTFVGQVERGERNLSLQNLLKLAAGLGVDPGELVQGLVERSATGCGHGS
jgi:transcriptional regulator with XRE-family HTH domain